MSIPEEIRPTSKNIPENKLKKMFDGNLKTVAVFRKVTSDSIEIEIVITKKGLIGEIYILGTDTLYKVTFTDANGKDYTPEKVNISYIICF